MRNLRFVRAPAARQKRWCGVTTFALLVATAPTLAAQARTPTKEPSPEVRKLVLRGVKHVDQHDLEQSIATQASKCRSYLLEPFCLVSQSPVFVEHHNLDRDEFRRDVLRIRVYYWKRGYRETTVDSSITPNGKGVTVTFAVHEGDPTIVAALRIDYDSTLMSAKRKNKLAILKVGKPLNLLTLDSMRLNFQQEMWDRGHSDAIVDTALSVNDSTRRRR